MGQRELLVAGAAIAALLLYSRRAQAHGADVTFPDDWGPQDIPQSYQGYHDPVYDAPADDAPPEVIEASDFEPDVSSVEDIWGVGLPTDYYHGAGGPLDFGNLNAFLLAIRRAEHYAADYLTGEDYRTFYGGAKFSDMSDHPVITGELQPVRLSAAQCRRLGFTSGNCVTTAAGAYQFTRPTWQRLRAKGTYLPDFSPASQDEAARRLLAELDVPAMLAAGDLAGAVRAASTKWASLPGSTAGQGGKSFAQVAQFYREAGGVVA